MEPWKEVSLDSISKRTHMGLTASLALKHGWAVRVARSVSWTRETTAKNGNVKPGKKEEHFWVGGAKPNFKEPKKVFLINKLYMKAGMEHCTFDELKKYVLEN